MQSLKFALQPAVINVSLNWDLPKEASVTVLSPPITSIFQGQRSLVYAQLSGLVREVVDVTFLGFLKWICLLVCLQICWPTVCDFDRAQQQQRVMWRWTTAWLVNHIRINSTSASNQLKTTGKMFGNISITLEINNKWDQKEKFSKNVLNVLGRVLKRV